jgi:hypothetical protein
MLAPKLTRLGEHNKEWQQNVQEQKASLQQFHCIYFGQGQNAVSAVAQSSHPKDGGQIRAWKTSHCLHFLRLLEPLIAQNRLEFSNAV